MQPLVQRRYDTPGLSPWCVLYHGLPLRCAGFWGGGDCHPCPCAALCAALSPVPNDCKLSRGAPRRGATRLERRIGQFPRFSLSMGSLGVSGCLWRVRWCCRLSAGAGAGLVVQFAGLWGHHSRCVTVHPLICPTPQATPPPTVGQRQPLFCSCERVEFVKNAGTRVKYAAARGSFYSSEHGKNSNSRANLA